MNEIRSACGTMLAVQLPFEVDDIDHFWQNHEAIQHKDRMYKKKIWIFLKESEIDDWPVTIKYQDKETTMESFDEYVHWSACWLSLRGSDIEARKEGYKSSLDRLLNIIKNVQI